MVYSTRKFETKSRIYKIPRSRESTDDQTTNGTETVTEKREDKKDKDLRIFLDTSMVE